MPETNDPTRPLLLRDAFYEGVTFTQPVRIVSKGSVRFESCRFEAGFVQPGLILDELRMKSCVVLGEFDIRGATITGQAELIACEVHGAAHLGLHIKDGRAEQSTFGYLAVVDCTIAGTLQLGGAKVVRQVRLENSVIKGTLSFRLWERPSTTKGEKAKPLFKARHHFSAQAIEAHGVRVEGDVTLRGARVEGRVVFTNAVIDGMLIARAWFPHHREDPKQVRRGVADGPGMPTCFASLMCARVRVGGAVDLGGATILGEVDFEHADIGSLLMNPCAQVAQKNRLDPDTSPLPMGDVPIFSEAPPDGYHRATLRISEKAVHALLAARVAALKWTGAHPNLEKSLIAHALDPLDGIQAPHEQSKEYATQIAGSLRVRTATVRGDIVMTRVTVFEGMDLAGATVHGSVRIQGRFHETTDRASATTQVFPSRIGARKQYMDAEVSIWGAGLTIHGDLVLSGARLTSGANLVGCTIHGSVSLNHLRGCRTMLGTAKGPDKREYSLRLSGSKIGGNVSFVGAFMEAGISLEGATVGGDVTGVSDLTDFPLRTVVQQATWTKNELAALLLNSLTCDGDIDLRGVFLDGGILCEGATIGGSILLGGIRLNGESPRRTPLAYHLHAPTAFVGCGQDSQGNHFSVFLDHSSISGGVHFEGATLAHGIRLAHTEISGDVAFESFQQFGLDRPCRIGPGTHQSTLPAVAVLALDARIGGNLYFRDCDCVGMIHAAGARLGSLRFIESRVRPSERRDPNEQRSLDTRNPNPTPPSETALHALRMPNARVEADIDLRGISLGYPLLFSEAPTLALVELDGTQVEGTVFLLDDPEALVQPSATSNLLVKFMLNQLVCRSLKIEYSPNALRHFKHFKAQHTRSTSYAMWITLIGWFALWALLLTPYFWEACRLLKRWLVVHQEITANFAITAVLLVTVIIFIRILNRHVTRRTRATVAFSTVGMQSSQAHFASRGDADLKSFKDRASCRYGRFYRAPATNHGGLFPWFYAPLFVIIVLLIVVVDLAFGPGTMVLLAFSAVLAMGVHWLTSFNQRRYWDFEEHRSVLARCGGSSHFYRAVEESLRSAGDHARADRCSLQWYSSYIHRGGHVCTIPQFFHIGLHFLIGHGVRWMPLLVCTGTLLLAGTGAFSSPDSMVSEARPRTSMGWFLEPVEDHLRDLEEAGLDERRNLSRGLARTMYLFLPVGRNIVSVQNEIPSSERIRLPQRAVERWPYHHYFEEGTNRLPITYLHLATALMIAGWILPPLLIYGLIKSAPRITNNSAS